MAQQINLCSPILLTQKKYLSAQTMAAGVGVFLVFGAALAGAWTWNLGRATGEYQTTMDTQATEMASLKAALERSKAAALPVDAALTTQLEERKQHLAQRRAALAALKEGALQPGNAHSARLRFLAATTPPAVWITGVVLASGRFQVSGYTLEPAALNEWVARMATDPLLEGLQLSDVQVQSMATSRSAAPAAAGVAPTAALASSGPGGRPVWSFELGSTRPVPADAVAKPGEAKR